MNSEMAADRIAPLYSMLLSVRDRLREGRDRLVLAESCTAGLVAAELGQIPGISEFFCGSMVVYRTPTKTAWLGISSELLDDPAVGPVSAEVTIALAQAVLEKTPEATIAAAITGHLGPGAPAEMDGQVHCAMVRRGMPGNRFDVQTLMLISPPASDLEDIARRRIRQKEAANALLGFLEKKL